MAICTSGGFRPEDYKARERIDALCSVLDPALKLSFIDDFAASVKRSKHQEPEHELEVTERRTPELPSKLLC